MTIVEKMKLFFEPRSVAVLGASRQTGPGAFNIVECLQAYGYPGKIYPINPHAAEILGLPCYPSAQNLPENTDLAVISVDRSQVLAATESCVQAGIKAIIIVAQGLGDIGGEGKLLQDKVRDLTRARGARIVGPNTMGVFNNFHNFTTSSIPMVNFQSPVSLICQSGIFIVAFYSFTGPVGKAIDLGNTCDVDFPDVLEYYATDPGTKVIALHIEGLQDGRRFLETARRITAHKTILALKTGRTSIGAQKAASHSGSMAGKDFLYSSAFEQSGIIRVRDTEELHDFTRGFSRLPLPKGNRIAVLTYSGGGGVIAVDRMVELGLPLAPLSAPLIGKLSPLIPSWLALGNPIDMWPSVMKFGPRPMFKTYLQALLEDEDIDGLLSIFLTPKSPGQEFLDASEEIVEAASRYPAKPIVVWPYGPDLGKMREKLDSSGRVVTLDSAERAVQLLSALIKRQKFLGAI